MGRQLRMVPKDWRHPTNERGHLIPLHPPMSAAEMKAEVERWYEAREQWVKGEHPDQADYPEYKPGAPKACSYTQWHGRPPNPDDYMPCWEPSECTHFQMYEDTTEGTPISPVCETAEELARWLADNGASAFADQTATYEEWLATIVRGHAVSMVIAGGVAASGVAAEAAMDRRKSEVE